MNIVEGFLLGLSNSAYCLGLCAPIILPYLLAGTGRPGIPLLKFLGGRLAAYLIFAATAGTAGLYFEGRINPRIFALLTIGLAGWMIAFAAGRIGAEFRACRWLGDRVKGGMLPFYAGMVMGVNICPPLLLGLNRALQMESVLKPVVFFTGFYAGSSVLLLLFLFTGSLVRKKEIQRIGQLASLLAGFWYLAQGILVLAGEIPGR